MASFALGQIGESIAQAKELQRKEAMEKLKLAIQQGQLGVEQEYAATNRERLGLEKSREAQLVELRKAQIAEIMKRVNQSPPMVQKLKDAETALGRPLKDDEKLATLGIKLPAVHQSEYEKTVQRLQAEAEMFKKYPELAKLLHPRTAEAGTDTRTIGDKAKDIEAGLATLKDFPTKERGLISTWMRLHDMKPGGKMKPEQEAGLNVLHVSLWGDPVAKTKGLADTVGVLDSTLSRDKMILAGVGTSPDPKEGFSSRLLHSAFYKRMTTAEKNYVYQLNRAVSAINALRTITGLPRSTQALMDRYIMELPNPVTTPSSADAKTQLQLIEREIRAALAGAGKGVAAEGVPSAAPDTLPGEEIEETEE